MDGFLSKEQQKIPLKGIVKTEIKSFLVVKFPNKTTNKHWSKIFISVFLISKREVTSLQVYKGKIRAIIEKTLGDDEKIYFNKAVALGVRGTEFFLYIINGKTTSDVALLEGKLSVNAKASAPKLKKFILKSGESFNTNELALSGLSAVKKFN